jgi:sugar fermentation stimulation protein A
VKFSQPLLSGRLIKRYKRFLADIELDNGELITAACPNTGSMLGCNVPGSRVWLSVSDSPTRKYKHTWELVEARPGVIVGINTGLPNRLTVEAIEAKTIKELSGYRDLKTEVRYGNENSRIDILLEGHKKKPPCYVEVKNVTAAVENGIALFPDAVSERGSKHLRELMTMVDEGFRAVLIFCVQRMDVNEVRPADAIDSVYGKTLRQALAHGVEVLAYRARISLREIVLADKIPVVCPGLK